MKLDPRIFQAIAIVHHGLMQNAQLPQDPMHVAHAKFIVEEIYKRCHNDSTMTLAASHIVCGYLNNKASAHCQPAELVGHTLTSIQRIIESFKAPTMPMQMAPGPQVLPVTAVPDPVPQPVPSFPEPTTPLEVPDFGTGQ